MADMKTTQITCFSALTLGIIDYKLKPNDDHEWYCFVPRHLLRQNPVDNAMYPETQ